MFEQNRKKIITRIILAVIIIGAAGGGFFIGRHTGLWEVPQPSSVDFSLFWDAYNKLHADYINPDAMTDQKIIYGAINGMTQSIGDPFTDFFDPTQAKD